MIRVARGESWIIDLTKKGDGLQRCAAPIVTELVEEIHSLMTGQMKLSFRSSIDYYKTWYVCMEDVETIFDTFEDELPNALADLWLWLKGREQ